jgi:hypothetical protein
MMQSAFLKLIILNENERRIGILVILFLKVPMITLMIILPMMLISNFLSQFKWMLLMIIDRVSYLISGLNSDLKLKVILD